MENATSNAALIDLDRQMSEHTAPECASVCLVPHGCCSIEYCELTLRNARRVWGIELPLTDHPDLPLMGPDGCTAAPHLRPLCTVHTCEISSHGFKRGDDAWTTRYFELRDELSLLEMARMAEED